MVLLPSKFHPVDLEWLALMVYVRRFPSPISAAGGIVVQYELKLEDSLQCGGAYIKLLRADTVEGK